MQRLAFLIPLLVLLALNPCFAHQEDSLLDILTPEQRQWLADHKGQIRYAPSPNYPPIGYVDQDGTHRGVTAEYINILEKLLKVRFIKVYCDTWAEILEKAKNGQVDLIGNIQQTTQRSAYLKFTKPYITISNAIIVRKEQKEPVSLDEMVGKTVAVVKGYASIDFIKKEHSNLKLKMVDDNLSGLQDVAFGRVDAMISDLAVASYYIENQGLANLKMAGTIPFTWNLSFATRKDWSMLQQILDKSLAAIPKEKKREIYRKWTTMGLVEPVTKETYYVAFLIIFATILTIVLVLWWNRRLKKEVRNRKAIEQALQKSHDDLRKTESLLASRFKLSTLAHQSNLDTVMQATLDEAEIMTESNVGFYHFVADDQEHLILQAWSTNTLEHMCSAEGKGQHYPISQAGIWKDCFHQRAPVIHQDYNSLSHKKGMPKGHAPVTRELTIPIVRNNKVKAIIGVGNKKSHYSEADIKVLMEFASFSFDLIEKKLAEQTVSKAALEWTTAMDGSGDVFYLLDTNRRILRANQAFYKVTGSSPETAIGKHIVSVVHPQGETVPCPVCLAQEELRDAVIVMEADEPHNPTSTPLEVTVSIVKNELLEPVSIFMKMRDLTNQRKIEDALRRSKEEWENTFDSMHEIITIQDKNMRIVKANKAAYKAFESQIGELKGKYCYEVFRKADYPCQDCPELRTFRDATPHSSNIKHDNLGKIFHVTSSPIMSVDGRFTHIVHIAKDITEQKKLEAELLQAHKMEAIGTLAGGIAHDFNNILSAILGYADMAKDDLPEQNLARNYVEQVLKAGYRAKELVQQILTFSRKGQEVNKPLQPAQIVQEVLKLIRASTPSTIEIREKIEPDCGVIMANPTNIHQILVNLCTNALHAMEEEKGVLTVQLSRVVVDSATALQFSVNQGYFIELMVEDSGCGMTENTMERIFEPYFTTKEVGKGSGMGLALVHGIVKDYGGFIKVKSVLNKGTTFHLYFPALEEKIVQVEEELAEDLPGGKERILVVDDEEVIVGVYKASLEKLGYEVTALTDSLSTLEKFRSSPQQFDLVITDQTMPGISGSELAQKILQIRADIPVILCTGYSSRISKEDAELIGVQRFIMKPLSRKQLALSVREVLDNLKRLDH